MNRRDRPVHFPEKIDPTSVKAEYRNGIFRLTAAIAKAAAAQKVNVKAASGPTTRLPLSTPRPFRQC